MQHLSTSLRNSPLFKSSFCRARSLHATRRVPQQPWFVDPIPQAFDRRANLPHLANKEIPSIPEDTPPILKLLHSHLVQSPHLDTNFLAICRATVPPPGPPLPFRLPHGRRNRGGTYAGESAYDTSGGLWDWTAIAQVKEGTENRGAIESVVRVIRKVLLTTTPPLPIPPKSRQQMGSGWAMIDAGTFAVHVVSKEVREKYLEGNITGMRL